MFRTLDPESSFAQEKVELGILVELKIQISLAEFVTEIAELVPTATSDGHLQWSLFFVVVVMVMMMTTTALDLWHKDKMMTSDQHEKLASPIFEPQSDQYWPTTGLEGLVIGPIGLDLGQVEHGR